jgi:hypothetical protein
MRARPGAAAPCAAPDPEFLLYTRKDCALCAEMRAALHAAAGTRRYRCHLIDVDDDAALLGTFGSRVPVLVAGGRVLCEAHFNARAVAEYLAGFEPGV